MQCYQQFVQLSSAGATDLISLPLRSGQLYPDGQVMNVKGGVEFASYQKKTAFFQKALGSFGYII